MSWAEPGAALDLYNARPRNVMVLTGVTFSFVAMLDQQIDGRADARFGRVRDITLADGTTTSDPTVWPLDDRMAFGTTAVSTRDEDQVAVTTALFQMTR